MRWRWRRRGGLAVAATPGESVWGLLRMTPATALETLEVFLGVAERPCAPVMRKIVSPTGPRIEAMVYVAPEFATGSQVADAAMVWQGVTAARRAGWPSLAVARLERCGRVKKDSR